MSNISSFEVSERARNADDLPTQVESSIAGVKYLQNNSSSSEADPALFPILNQVENHLEHVTYNFKIASDSDDFPYRLRRTEAYPTAPTQRAIDRAQRLFDLLQTDGVEDIEIEISEQLVNEALEQQNKVIERLLNDPLEVYEELQDRRRQEGQEANFPELGWTLKSLAYDMITKSEVQEACSKSPLLTKLKKSILADISPKIQSNNFGYESTINAIEDAVAFFDIVIRSADQDTPPTYHSKRFEYNWHSLSEDPDLILIPTMAGFTPADLLKIRGVPVGVIGVATDTIRVDGFPQTPHEFFHHDVDHTRRMHEEMTAGVERDGVSLRQYITDANELLFDRLLPAIDIEGITDEDARDRRIAMRMILFEILHEDATDPSRDSIADAILRAPMERTPFERLIDNKTVEYYMAPRASTLAHVFRKLAHTFYDLPESRSTSIGTDFTRTRLAIAQGAADLYRLVSDDPIDDNSLLNTCRDLVSTDEGFTDSFMGNIAHDIAQRAVGRSTLSLMVSRPLGVAAAVRRIRQKEVSVHSLFGYSGLEYEDPRSLEETVLADLENFNPEETIIAIGATPYGIGRLYPAVKELGFLTMGIVASTALGLNEECAEGVDEIVVVKDNGWGGYRYNRASDGLLSPTTRVFLGASDSIAAYGGGEITAVTLEEALRRGKKVSFKPFDMNHRIADMTNAQRGNSAAVDYRGPANAKWSSLDH